MTQAATRPKTTANKLRSDYVGTQGEVMEKGNDSAAPGGTGTSTGTDPAAASGGGGPSAKADQVPDEWPTEPGPDMSWPPEPGTDRAWDTEDGIHVEMVRDDDGLLTVTETDAKTGDMINQTMGDIDADGRYDGKTTDGPKGYRKWRD